MRTQDCRPLRAVVLDIDGTLYCQRPVRRAMLLRLLAAYVTKPLEGGQTAVVLRAYRRAQEEIRRRGGAASAGAQMRLTCERTGLDDRLIAACVERWMEREPLAVLSRY